MTRITILLSRRMTKMRILFCNNYKILERINSVIFEIKCFKVYVLDSKKPIQSTAKRVMKTLRKKYAILEIFIKIFE